jgi:DeoR family fructose operon transcriptional repressor
MRLSSEQIRERKSKILDLVEDTDHLSVSKISENLGIPVSTARRYMRQMEIAGEILRTSTGIIKTRNEHEEYLTQKNRLRKAEKRAIALEARGFIKEGDIILVGGGSTTFELAKLLRDAKNLHVVTTSIHIALELYQNPNLQVEMVGGIINQINGAATSVKAINYLNSIHVYKAFLGADSISIEQGISTPSYFEADVEKVVIQNSSAVYVLADYTKFDKVTLTPLAEWSQIHCLITDSKTNRVFLDKIEKLGVKVIQTGNK